MTIKPGTAVPSLTLPLVGGGRFSLDASQARTFSMLVVYRGRHCPICKAYLTDLEHKLDAFAEHGVEVVAISTDSQEAAEATSREWAIERTPIAHGLGIDEARAWGLFVSSAIKAGEPALFAEPGLFLVRPDRTLYCASIQTMPFARPAFADVLKAVAFVTENDYPPRGDA